MYKPIYTYIYIPLEKTGGGMGQVFCSTNLPGNPLSFYKLIKNLAKFLYILGGVHGLFWNVDFCHLKRSFSTKF